MQQATDQLQNQLWGRLKKVFVQYAEPGGNQMLPQKMESIVSDVLGNNDRSDIDYVMKNLFRLDIDNSGKITFFEFGNFLFKRYCGEISLQKMHKAEKMIHGKDRKMTLDEFNILINNAYSFLGVNMPAETAKQVFQETDKDKDGLITYVEYFQIIDITVCKTVDNTQQEIPPKPVEKPVEVVPTGRQWMSRLRTYLWNELRKIYMAYMKDRKIQANQQQLRLIIQNLVRDLSSQELNFIISGLYEMQGKIIQFQVFVVYFFYLIAEIGLMRFGVNHSPDKKTLNRDEFVLLFRNTFSFLNVSRVRKSLLHAIFRVIDKDHDGLISFKEYLDWIRRFIACLKYLGEQFYTIEDDASKPGELFEPERPSIKHIPSPPVTISKDTLAVHFVFSDYSLASLVRKRCYELLQPYDQNHDGYFQESDIHRALVDLLSEDENQLAYVTRNVFRYDVDNDQRVTYSELTNFCVEQHFGEMAIQRLHRKGNYSRGKERIMNKQEFGFTLNFALSFLKLQASNQQVDLLFSEIDLDKDGWITYQVYFLFLKYYFGSLSINTQKEMKTEIVVNEDEEYLKGLKGLSAFERFVRLLLDQLRKLCMIYDINKNLLFDTDEISVILAEIFNLSPEEISYVLKKYFRIESGNEKEITFEELMRILLQIYFAELLLKNRYEATRSPIWTSKKISLAEFIVLIQEGSFFIRIKPSKEDLTIIFRELDTDKDGYITFTEYINFIKKYLGGGIIPEESPKPKQPLKEPIKAPTDVSTEELDFIDAIWSELKVYFDKYDSGSKGFHNQEDLKRFVIEVLKENTQRQLDYVFWNLFRVDSNENKEVDFQQFAPFILSHAGQIALQRFHREQVTGKKQLNEAEIYIVFSNAFVFLRSMPKSKPAVSKIFNRIKKGSQLVSYPAYLSWISYCLARKFR